MFNNASEFIKNSTVQINNRDEFIEAANNKKLIFTKWCDCPECEDSIKEETGAKTLNKPFKQAKIEGNCPLCGKPAKTWVYFAKSY